MHHRPAGFTSYAELRRGSRPIQLEPDLTVHVSSLRDIIRSRLAAGDDRQLPALEAALELEGGSGYEWTAKEGGVRDLARVEPVPLSVLVAGNEPTGQYIG